MDILRVAQAGANTLAGEDFMEVDFCMLRPSSKLVIRSVLGSIFDNARSFNFLQLIAERVTTYEATSYFLSLDSWCNLLIVYVSFYRKSMYVG